MTIADVTKALTPVLGMMRERFLLVFQVARLLPSTLSVSVNCKSL